MKQLIPVLRKKLKALDITDLMMGLTETAVMPHCEFRIVLTGCTNACTSPYFSDFGVLGVYDVELVSEKCSGCGQCVSYCSLGVINMDEGLPAFEMEKCIKCGGCEEFCPEAAIKVGKMGYKVVAGGTGARFPKIAQTINEYTDLAGVLKILEDIVSLIREKHTSGRIFDISALVNEYRKSL